MMLRGWCHRCGLPIAATWPDRPEDKGVRVEKSITCFVCDRATVQVSGKGGPAA